MAGTVPARLNALEGRKFGLTVGLALLALAAVLLWRGRITTATVVGSLGGALALAAAVVPTLLGPVMRAWMGFAHLLSKVTTPVFLGIVYFVIFAPVGLFRRMLGKNALVRRQGSAELASGGFWIERRAGARRGDITKQF